MYLLMYWVSLSLSPSLPLGVGDVVPCLERQLLSDLGETEQKEGGEEEGGEEERETQGDEGAQDKELTLHPQPDSHTESNIHVHDPTHLS